VQEPYVGKVLLCIDVSGSMGDRDGIGPIRLRRAVAGAERFVEEASAAGYRIGLVLWDHGVHKYVPLSSTPRPVLKALSRAKIAGGTDVTPALRLGISELGHLTGDRVMAIFGDGDIGPVPPAVAASREAAALGIRIIVRGLGDYSAAQLKRIATETDATVVKTAADIERGIASMAASITARAKRRR
jgi:uncharacterized protein (DUF58 family)